MTISQLKTPTAWGIFSAFVLLWPATFAHGQRAEESNPLRKSEMTSNLTTKQERLAKRYDQLEILAGRLAELSAATQPRRARLLRELVASSRERDIAGRFAKIINALDSESLGKASTGQAELQIDLQKMLDLLLQEDRSKQIESERKRIRKYLAELKKLIQLQRGVKARTDGGDETKEVTKDQTKLSDATQQLGAEIEAKEINQSDKPSDPQSDHESNSPQATKPNISKNSNKAEDEKKSPSAPKSDSKQSDHNPNDSPSKQDAKPQEQEQAPAGKPNDSPPSQGQSQPSKPSDDADQSNQPQTPAERAQQSLEKAQQRMQQAIKDLENTKQDDAVQRQEQALRELEQAKAELERILRQLREEELERTLVMLEARFRKMLDAQVVIYEQTKKLDKNKSSVPEHEIEIASSRLSRQEREIVREADRALLLLREDGTTVAFPEAIQQARDDMKSVEKRLSEVKISVITLGLEEDIIAALEETLSALQQAIKQARAKQGQPQQSSGEPDDQSLVDQLAELRMIRALQNRINRRTKRYGDIIGEGLTDDPDLRAALDELSVRQERVFQATRDLDSERNQ